MKPLEFEIKLNNYIRIQQSIQENVFDKRELVSTIEVMADTISVLQSWADKEGYNKKDFYTLLQKTITNMELGYIKVKIKLDNVQPKEMMMIKAEMNNKQ